MRLVFDVDDFPKSIAGKLNEILESSHTVIEPLEMDNEDTSYLESFIHLIEGYGYKTYTKVDDINKNLTHIYMIPIKNFINVDKSKYQSAVFGEYENLPIKLNYFSYLYYYNICNDKLICITE